MSGYWRSECTQIDWEGDNSWEICLVDSWGDVQESVIGDTCEETEAQFHDCFGDVPLYS